MTQINYGMDTLIIKIIFLFRDFLDKFFQDITIDLVYL